ncbi:MAG: HAD hydrolase-like protein, partial [Bacteroidales bacterium]|nr:HAD hydrolase-like protein [Bacteroidales bacterium]
ARRPCACLRLLARERRARRRLSAAKRPAGFDTLYAAIASGTRYSFDEVRIWYNEWYMPTMIGLLGKHYSMDSEMVAKAREFKSQGSKIAVLSDYGCVREKLEALGGRPEMFDALLDAPSLGGFKPTPDVFRAACARLGVDPCRCALVGDRPDTDGGCTSVGMTFIQK